MRAVSGTSGLPSSSRYVIGAYGCFSGWRPAEPGAVSSLRARAWWTDIRAGAPPLPPRDILALMPRRAVRVVLLVLAAMGLLGWLVHRALNPVPAGKGDPGNRRLHQLADDPVFQALPPDTTSSRITLSPAKVRATGYLAVGWSGPSMTLTFETSADPRSVFEYYQEQAPAYGWRSQGVGALGVPVVWRKTYANGAEAWISIFTAQLFDDRSGPREYQLRGGISLPR
jgi:hypothetical protein